MQSVFQLPSWNAQASGSHIMEKSTLHKSRPMPVVEMPNYIKIKRKRTDSPEPASAQHAHVVKKWKGANGESRPINSNVGANFADRLVVEHGKPAAAAAQDAPKPASAEGLDSRLKAHPVRKEGVSKSRVSKPQKPVVKIETNNTVSTAMDSGLTPVQKAIEAQIDYEILLKHNELRLVEQELAKCQIALEQLRRCSMIPFPGNEGLSEDLSLGLGAALQSCSGYTAPQYAAPWGVTDGPYTRHYAKWLISDIKFDPVSERALAQQAHSYFGTGEGRTTRGSFGDFSSANRGRTSRTSTGMLKLPSLGETPAPAPKVDPLLLQRSTDNQWVRLFCAQCGHSNFSNTQGFLNHCRIKHGQVFKSHDQAAIACGVPVDMDKVGDSVAATESTTTATSAVTFPVPITPGIVHPLVTQSAILGQAKDVYRDPATASRDISISATLASFKKSSSTPYLSAQLQKRGFEGDLKDLVETAKAKVDLDAMDTSDDDVDTSALPTPVSVHPPQLTRLPASVASGNKAPMARPGMRTGNGQSHTRLPPLFSTPATPDGGHMLHSPAELSPNALEPNPGLVSDHDDDDDDDADDARSHSDTLNDHDVVVEDASDGEGVHQHPAPRPDLHGCFEQGEGSHKH